MRNIFIIKTEKFWIPTNDITNLSFDLGAHILIKNALYQVPVGNEISVFGSAPQWQAQLSAWCRNQGHAIRFDDDKGKPVAYIKKSCFEGDRWKDAFRTGCSDPKTPQ